MKICFVSPYSPTTVAGVGTFITELSKGLGRRGHESITISVVQDTYYKEKSKIHLIEVDCGKFRRLKDFCLSTKTALILLKLRKEIDIVHCQAPHPQSLLSAIIGKIIGLPIVTTLHGKLPRPKHSIRKKALNLFEKFVPYLSDAVVFVSEMTKSEFAFKNGTVIYNGIDTKRFSPDDNERNDIRDKLKLGDQFVILFAGRLAENKGIFELIEAFSRVRHLTSREIKLYLIGDGDEITIQKALQRIQMLKIENHVVFIRRVDDILNYLRIADLFVLPSYFEGLPLSLLEAMACGLPVIASKVGGNIEVIKNGINGLFIEPRNIDDLKGKIVWVIKHRSELGAVGRNARLTVEKKFDLTLMTEKYAEIYQRLISKG